MAAQEMNTVGIRSVFHANWRREWHYLFANPSELLLMTVLPCVLLVILAWLLSPGVIRELPIAVVDRDESSLSREVIHRLDASPGLHVASVVTDLNEAWSRVRRMDVYAVVLIPDRATKRLFHQGRSQLVVYYNASYLTSGQGAMRDVAAAVGSVNADILQREIGKMHGAAGVRPPPMVLQSTTISNPQRSFEHYLLGILFPSILHLFAALSLVSALGREVRDETLSAWLGSSDHPLVAIAGKLAPYVGVYWAFSCMGLAYLAVVRGGEIAGSVLMLGMGMFALYAACAGLALLFVGALRDMGTALSLCGLYFGTAMAFSGATFPIYGAAFFARIWNSLLPLTAYLKLQAQQVDVGSPVLDSFRWLLALLLFSLIPGMLGARLLMRPAREETSA